MCGLVDKNVTTASQEPKLIFPVGAMFPICGNFIEQNYHKRRLYLLQIHFSIYLRAISIRLFLPEMPFRYTELEELSGLTFVLKNKETNMK